ncbi:MAG: family 16 glycosylhydrolase [Muribaculaceae bacterium]|nr:family 16 glycosylhydrolase [Muribaculaceae bacterium]
MKTKLLLLANLLFVALGVCACGGDNDEPAPAAVAITVSSESLTFEAAGGDAGIEVSTTGREWDAAASDSWLTIRKSGTASAKGSVTVTVAANTTHKERTASVKVVSGTTAKEISVKQAGKEYEPVDPSILVPDGYELVWNDEFDTPGRLDPAHWTHEVQGPGWVNNELQTYVKESVNGVNVTEVVDGHLAIHCFKQGDKVYSGRVYANVGTGWTYGIFEASIKLPTGRGTWPAYWMMPVNNDFAANPWPRCGEIDIMEEVGYHANYTSSSIHCEAYNHVMGTQKTAERLTQGAQDDYHTYRLEWTPDYIATYVDDKALLIFNNDGKGNVATWPFFRPFYVIFNLAWGGDWGAAQGVDESCLPATMEVDYIRVFQKL